MSIFILPILCIMLMNLPCGLAKVAISELGALAAGEDQLCNPSGVTFRYTGIRLYQTVIYDLPIRHFWYLIRCKAGKVASQQYFPTNRTANFQFAHPVSISSDETYILARFKKYALRKIPIYRPLAEVGAIYKHNRTTNFTELLYPLSADNMGLKFTLTTTLGRSMKYIPILFTPEEDSAKDWESRKGINPYENYSFSEEEKHTVWYTTNSLMNAISDALTNYSNKLVFWEFEGLQLQLAGIDWRRPANLAVPNV